LGSVRLMINTDGAIENYYTYNPFGELFPDPETDENVSNPFKFTGQWYDSEIQQYYLRARMYDPYISRFTSRDPATGNFGNPSTLHKYLYCNNDPINHVDPNGRLALNLLNPILTGAALYFHGINLAVYAASSFENWKFFDLAYVTHMFMSPAMTIAAFTPIRNPFYYVPGFVGSAILESAFRITGMSFVEGFSMDPAAFIAYSGAMFTAEVILDITEADMRDFARWRGPWW
ncbi:MAG: RHS repeat-associated core domain-containing protein, partial [Sedimentisphaerales bacterium]|nr:RHS repeat-associated core domain-containing protein [Sedimentisphaerales bacterium]